MKKILFLMVLVLMGSSNLLMAKACYDDNRDRPIPPFIACNNTNTVVDETEVNECELDYISGVSSVEDGLLLSINNQTKHGELLGDAMNVWNQLGVITLEYSDDYNVTVFEENLGDNGVIATYIYQEGVDVITINSYYFETLSNNAKVRVLVHELGHALGLDDTSYYDSVMVQGISEEFEVSEKDEDLLRSLWTK